MITKAERTTYNNNKSSTSNVQKAYNIWCKLKHNSSSGLLSCILSILDDSDFSNCPLSLPFPTPFRVEILSIIVIRVLLFSFYSLLLPTQRSLFSDWPAALARQVAHKPLWRTTHYRVEYSLHYLCEGLGLLAMHSTLIHQKNQPNSGKRWLRAIMHWLFLCWCARQEIRWVFSSNVWILRWLRMRAWLSSPHAVLVTSVLVEAGLLLFQSTHPNTCVT